MSQTSQNYHRLSLSEYIGPRANRDWLHLYLALQSATPAPEILAHGRDPTLQVANQFLSHEFSRAHQLAEILWVLTLPKKSQDYLLEFAQNAS